MRLIAAVLAGLALFLGPNFVRAAWDGAGPAGEPRLVAAMFRSSWCGACRVLEPRVDDVRDEYDGAAIDWVRFNFTWGQRDGLRDLAVAEGIAPLYDELAGRTGFLVLMDRETGQVFEIVTMDYDRDRIREALDRWLVVTERLESVERGGNPSP